MNQLETTRAVKKVSRYLSNACYSSNIFSPLPHGKWQWRHLIRGIFWNFNNHQIFLLIQRTSIFYPYIWILSRDLVPLTSLSIMICRLSYTQKDFFSSRSFLLWQGSLPSWVAFTIFGVASAVGGVLALLLPETLGSTLPDTFQDVEVPNSQSLFYTFTFCSLKILSIAMDLSDSGINEYPFINGRGAEIF